MWSVLSSTDGSAKLKLLGISPKKDSIVVTGIANI